MAAIDGSAADVVVEILTSRRSLRTGFSGREVPEPVLEALLRCGLAAPSSKNAQPWGLHPVCDRSSLDQIASAVEEADKSVDFVPIDPVTGERRPQFVSTVPQSAAVLREVPLGLFIENRASFSGGRASLTQADPADLGNALIGYTLEVIGLGAAIQNLWIAGEAYGLRGVFMGDVLIAEAAIARILGLEGDLVGVLALGYPADPKVLPPPS